MLKKKISTTIIHRDSENTYTQKGFSLNTWALIKNSIASPTVSRAMANSKAKLITIVKDNAMVRLFSQVRFSMISDDRLKACIRLLMPLVAKYNADKKPIDNNLPLWMCMMSLIVAWKAM